MAGILEPLLPGADVSTSAYPERYLNVRQTATYLSMSRHTLYERVSQRAIPFIKLGRKLLFDKHDLDRWISRQKVPLSEA